MKFLLDMHIFLWWILEDPKLSGSAENTLADPENALYLSAASTWEMVKCLSE